jgi:hypothetical protein
MIEVVPPTRLGPVEIDVTMEEAEQRLRHDGAARVGEVDGVEPGTAHYASGLTLQAHPGVGRRVEAVEAYRPMQEHPVVFHSIDLFRTPAHEVEESLRRETEVLVEENGCNIIAPTLLLSLWRPFVADSPDADEGYYFQSALVARPGYYD